MGGKPSRGTSADKRLKGNQGGSTKSGSSGSSRSGKRGFGSKKAAPFAKGGGRKR